MAIFLKAPFEHETPFARQLRRAREADERIAQKREGAKVDAADSHSQTGAVGGASKQSGTPAATGHEKTTAGQVKSAAVTVAATAAVAAALAVPIETELTAPAREAGNNLPAIVFTVTNNGKTVLADDDEEKKRPAARAPESIPSKIWQVFKSGAGLIATLALQFASFFLTSVFTALTGGKAAGLLGFLGEALAGFALLLIIISWLYKKLFPNRKLSALWTIKNLAITFAFAVVIAVGKRLLAFLPEQRYAVIAVVAEAVLRLGLTGICAMRVLACRGEKKTLLSRAAASLPVRRAALCFTLFTAISCAVRLIALRLGGGAVLGWVSLAAALAFAAVYAAVRLKKRRA